MLSNIGKNIETLEEYHNYKKFLDLVASKSHHMDGLEDSSDDENRHPNILGKAFSANPTNPKLLDITNQPINSKNDNKINKDIYEKLRVNKDIIDLIENDSITYKLKFKSPDDLLKHFALLEEKNLFLIQQTQEAEQAIEDKILEFELEKKRIDAEIERVSHDMQEINDKITKNRTEMKHVIGIKDNLSNMSPDLINKIKQKIKSIVINTTDSSVRSEGHNENAIHLLSIIEKQIVDLFRRIEAK